MAWHGMTMPRMRFRVRFGCLCLRGNCQGYPPAGRSHRGTACRQKSPSLVMHQSPSISCPLLPVGSCPQFCTLCLAALPIVQATLMSQKHVGVVSVKNRVKPSLGSRLAFLHRTDNTLVSSLRHSVTFRAPTVVSTRGRGRGGFTPKYQTGTRLFVKKACQEVLFECPCFLASSLPCMCSWHTLVDAEVRPCPRPWVSVNNSVCLLLKAGCTASVYASF